MFWSDACSLLLMRHLFDDKPNIKYRIEYQPDRALSWWIWPAPNATIIFLKLILIEHMVSRFKGSLYRHIKLGEVTQFHHKRYGGGIHSVVHGCNCYRPVRYAEAYSACKVDKLHDRQGFQLLSIHSIIWFVFSLVYCFTAPSLPLTLHHSLCSVLLCYDHILTLSDEIEFFWKAKPSRMTKFFLATRYLCIFTSIPIALKSWLNWSQSVSMVLHRLKQIVNIWICIHRGSYDLWVVISTIVFWFWHAT